jgi:hypothetical protein
MTIETKKTVRILDIQINTPLPAKMHYHIDIKQAQKQWQIGYIAKHLPQQKRNPHVQTQVHCFHHDDSLW